MILNPLQKSALSDFVRRHLSEEGHLDSHSPELGLHYCLGMDRPEWFVLKGERLWTTGPQTVAGAAAKNSQVEVLNPVGSSLLVIVTAARVINSFAAGAQQYTLAIDPAAAATPAQNLPRDTRIAGIQSQNRISNANLVSGNLIEQVDVTTQNADAEFEATLPIILTPGHRLAIFANTVNIQLTALFAGYEYIPLVEEINP